MHNYSRFFHKTTISSQRYFSVRKRKFPLNPDEINKLPVFQYPVSKKEYNRVYVWGNIQTGALGVPYLKSYQTVEKRYSRSPKRLGFGERFEVTTAACGFGFSLFAVKSQTNEKLYGTGLNTDSQIGYHTLHNNKPLDCIVYPQVISLPLKNPDKSNVNKISAGRAHSVILTDEGIFLLGNNAYGQCGRPVVKEEDYSNSNYINTIVTLDSFRIVDVECGQDNSLIITEDGGVHSCGWGADGQTGLGHYKSCSSFSRLKGDISTERIVKISCKSDFALALNDKGEVFGWGNTEYGQISLPSEEQQLCTPSYIEMLKALGKITDIATGGSHCAVLNEDGEVFVWGYGLLGTGPNIQQSLKPIKIPPVLLGKNDFQPKNSVVKIVSGVSHMAAITNQGDVYTWGRNRSCCLGLGNEANQYFPLKVSLAGFVQEAYCGMDHTIVICKPFI